MRLLKGLAPRTTKHFGTCIGQQRIVSPVIKPPVTMEARATNSISTSGSTTSTSVSTSNNCTSTPDTVTPKRAHDWRSKPYRPPLASSHYCQRRDHTHNHHAHYNHTHHHHREHHSFTPSPNPPRPISYRQPYQTMTTWTPPPSVPLPRGQPYGRASTPHGRYSSSPSAPYGVSRSYGGYSNPSTPIPPGNNDVHRNTQPPPPRRPKVFVADFRRNSNKMKYPLISVVTYNLLAQDLLRKNMFLYSNNHPQYLQWEHRKRQLLREILDTRADIFCFQEVQEEHFVEWYYPELNAKGYNGFFQKRTGSYSDGCAVFYNQQKLQMVENKKILFQKGTGTLVRDNVGIIVKFTLTPHRSHPPSVSPWSFCVATTHLLFNHKAGEIKLTQISYLMAELHKMAATTGSSEPTLPCIICGDFNSLPGSPMLKFLLSGRLEYSNLSAWDISGYKISLANERPIPVPLIPPSVGITQDSVFKDSANDNVGENSGQAGTETEMSSNTDQSDSTKIDPIKDGQSSKQTTTVEQVNQSNTNSDNISSTPCHTPSPILTHPFALHSGYAMPLDHTHRPPTVTTYHRSACETVDYILYTPSANKSPGFHLVSRTALPSQHVLRQYGPQPNHAFSSDHLYLQVDLQLVK